MATAPVSPAHIAKDQHLEQSAQDQFLAMATRGAQQRNAAKSRLTDQLATCVPDEEYHEVMTAVDEIMGKPTPEELWEAHVIDRLDQMHQRLVKLELDIQARQTF